MVGNELWGISSLDAVKREDLAWCPAWEHPGRPQRDTPFSHLNTAKEALPQAGPHP
jgi:hypothetical protein